MFHEQNKLYRRMKRVLYQIKQRLKRKIRQIWSGPYYKTTNPYWVQQIPVNRVNNREQFFIKFCKNKEVIHFGCTDWPIFNSRNNLHIKLSKYTKTLEGFDIDYEGIENLRTYVDQPYYSNFDDIPTKSYDVCLVPETIEHVDNVKDFLVNISNINAKKFLITAPNCFATGRYKRNYSNKDYFIELVHPDHNCWYSPYTLKNQIEKYAALKVIKVYLLDDERMICCEAIKN